MRLFLLQFRGELLKLFARKRTYIGFGAFLAIETILVFLLSTDRIERSIRRTIESSGFAADDYLSGLTLALMVLKASVLLLGALYLALVAGDVMSKEIEDGTLRMMLCRPVSRLRLAALKALATMVYTFVLAVFISVTALIAGLIYGGTGGLFAADPIEKIFALYDFGPGLAHYAAAIPLLALSLFTISALGFFFSCLPMKPAAATILTLSIFFIDMILKNIPYLESIREWFLTYHMAAWLHVFNYQIPWESMAESYIWLLAIDATLVTLGWLAFQQRDFKS
jgi:ABC-2 type transport system permease protein